MPYVRQEDRRAQKQRWNEANPELKKEHARKWAAKNREYFAKWREANKDKIRAYRQARKGVLRRFDKMGLGKAEGEALLQQRTVCVFCGAAGILHLDHKLPKSRGGSNRPENLQWLCQTCNQAKGALTVEEFFAHIQKVLARRG
jgi:5-methylcytosine-specific restriction endonuclease McrA